MTGQVPTQIKIGLWTLALALAAAFVHHAITRDALLGLFGMAVLFSAVMIFRGVWKDVMR